MYKMQKNTLQLKKILIFVNLIILRLWNLKLVNSHVVIKEEDI